MAGIYLHIPFCKQACHYCDFHFSTNTAIRKELLQAMAEEISLQRNYLQERLDTVYFGGGTPSLLDSDEVGFLLDKIRQCHPMAADTEVTLEANPDDLTIGKAQDLKRIGINRLSIGIQSFDDTVLRYLNRAHTSATALGSIEDARLAGFENISIDLIYAIPGLSSAQWREDIAKAVQLRPQHISAYTLTVEEKTAFGKWFAKGTFLPVDEAVAAEQMEILVTALTSEGYRQYEVSNFALPGFESRHNRNYWEGGKYLGIGPSAHSYNLTTRQHNVANNHLYVRSLGENKVPAESEILKTEDRINEYILTTLRTDVGCDLTVLKNNFGYDVLALHERYLSELQKRNLLFVLDNRLRLTDAGRLLADKISSDLFLVE
jgi:oxygen-independent coproporphyrinogen III oxidase